MFDKILGAIAGPLITGFLGDEREEDQRHSVEQQQDKNIELQREFAQHGIQWRVEDAKKAGLHPMYALTGGGAAFAPNPIVMPGGGNNSSRDYGDAVTRGLAALFASQEKKDEALVAAAASTAALGRAVAASSLPFPGYTPGEEMSWPSYPAPGPSNLQRAVDVQDYVSPQVLSRRGSDSSMTPGVGPGGTEHEIAPGFRMILPSSQSGGVSEALEALSESWEMAYAYVQRNVDAFGVEWLDQAQRFLPFTATLAKVINNVRNASSWIESPASVGAAFDRLGHRSREWLQQYRESGNGRGPTVSGRIRR